MEEPIKIFTEVKHIKGRRKDQDIDQVGSQVTYRLHLSGIKVAASHHTTIEHQILVGKVEVVSGKFRKIANISDNKLNNF